LKQSICSWKGKVDLSDSASGETQSG